LSVYNGSHGYFLLQGTADLLGGAVTRTLNEGAPLSKRCAGNMSFHLLLTLYNFNLASLSTRLLLFFVVPHACDNSGRVYCSVAVSPRNERPSQERQNFAPKAHQRQGYRQKDEHGPHNTNVYELVA